jgi:hypothetical protein
MSDKENTVLPESCIDCEGFRISSTYGDRYCFVTKKPKKVGTATYLTKRPRWCPRGTEGKL